MVCSIVLNELTVLFSSSVNCVKQCVSTFFAHGPRLSLMYLFAPPPFIDAVTYEMMLF